MKFPFKEYLLVVLAEEAAEVQKKALKCLRFGINYSEVEGHQSNLDKLETEWNELVAIVEMLNEEGVKLRTFTKLIEAKKARIGFYYDKFSKLTEV
jgi:hypothetical protein